MARDPLDDETLDIDFGDPELNDPNYGSDEDDNSVTSTSTDDTQSSSAPADTHQGDEGTDNEQSAVGADGAEQQGADGRAVGDDKATPVARGGTRDDGKGNLIDADGKLIAAAGAERRHYERVQQQARYIARLEQEYTDAKKAADLSNALNGLPAQLGLDAQETELGMQMIASFKKDPVATARWALQETMKMGYNLAQIVGADAAGQAGVSGSLDLQAIKAMIAQAVEPFAQDRTTVVQQEQQQAAAQREYDAFVAKHEHATVHEDTLAAMLNNDASLTPEVAYWQLREYAAKHGLDFTQPLRAQVLAREQQQQTTQTAPNGNARQHAQQRQQPMPNGGSPVADMRDDDEIAAPNDSWDTIVQQSLRAAGMA